ncbi:Indoleamine 2,3-dioxygenase 2 [Sparganum proliferum]
MLSLNHYQLDETTGCLQRSPTPMPALLQPFADLLRSSHKLLGTKELRKRIEELPKFDASSLKTLGEQRLAHKILAFLASQYVWHEGNDTAAEVLPAVIAQPLMDVSLALGCQPLLGHIDLVLSNCFPEESRPGDIKPPTYYIEFTPSGHSAWTPFIERTADIEVTFAAAPPLMMKVLQAIRIGDQNAIEICLRKFPPMLETMKQQMLRLLSELDPQEFYVDLRKYLSGWSHGRLTKGLIYEGVPDDLLTGQEMNGSQDGRRIYLGASAAQSAILQTLDAFLGVKHGPEVEEFLVRMRAYMIHAHRQFIEDMEKYSTLRDYVSQSCSGQLRDAYNDCISSLEKFRRDHIQIVHRFVLEPARKFATNVESLKNEGTGGQALNIFLGKVISSTKMARLSEAEPPSQTY